MRLACVYLARIFSGHMCMDILVLLVLHMYDFFTFIFLLHDFNYAPSPPPKTFLMVPLLQLYYTNSLPFFFSVNNSILSTQDHTACQTPNTCTSCLNIEFCYYFRRCSMNANVFLVYLTFITCCIYPRMYVDVQRGKGESWTLLSCG